MKIIHEVQNGYKKENTTYEIMSPLHTRIRIQRAVRTSSAMPFCSGNCMEKIMDIQI